MADLIAKNLWLCQDCTMLTANGTLGSEDEKADNDHAEAMVEHLEPYREDMPADRNPAACVVLDSGSIEFASRGCDGCGTTLHGYRHKAALIA